jgi:hypothetical protein
LMLRLMPFAMARQRSKLFLIDAMPFSFRAASF